MAGGLTACSIGWLAGWLAGCWLVDCSCDSCVVSVPCVCGERTKEERGNEGEGESDEETKRLFQSTSSPTRSRAPSPKKKRKKMVMNEEAS